MTPSTPDTGAAKPANPHRLSAGALLVKAIDNWGNPALLASILFNHGNSLDDLVDALRLGEDPDPVGKVRALALPRRHESAFRDLVDAWPEAQAQPVRAAPLLSADLAVAADGGIRLSLAAIQALGQQLQPGRRYVLEIHAA